MDEYYFSHIYVCLYVYERNQSINCVYTFVSINHLTSRIKRKYQNEFEIDLIINSNLSNGTHKWIEPIDRHSKLILKFKVSFYMRYQKKNDVLRLSYSL